jgi:UDP-glucose 4-epimerase
LAETLNKLLISGDNGYIGSHTALILNLLGHGFLLLANVSNIKANVTDNLMKITGRNIHFIRGDVFNTQLVSSIITQNQIDIVFHLAGLKSVGESSCNPIDEFHPTNAANPYGLSKLQVEQILVDLSHSAPEWRLVRLRCFNPIGVHHNVLIDEYPNNIPNILRHYMAQIAEGLRYELMIHGSNYPTSDSTGVRDYIHITDLANRHTSVLDFLENNTGGMPLT